MDNKNYYGFVYITTNNINGKKYIGQKCYKYKNWENYLGSGIYLVNAVNKYSRENFSREIIENCETKELLDEREKYWISIFEAVESNDFYNIAPGGEGGNTTKGYTDIQLNDLKLKFSKIRKGKINLGAKNGNATKVICLNTMEIFNTIKEASNKYNISEDLIMQCCREKSKLKTAGLLENTGERMIWNYYIEGKIYKYEPFIKQKPDRSRPVYCITTDEYFKSAKVGGLNYNIKPQSITQCCRNQIKSAGKHPLTNKKLVWMYYEDFVCQNDNGELIYDKTKLITIN